MGKRAGGIAGMKGMDNQIYFIPEVAKVIIDKISSNFPEHTSMVLDACANDGVLGEAVYNWHRERGLLVSVDYNDIKHTEENDKIITGDILKYKPNFKYDIIICNPPFIPVTLPESIYHHLMSLLNTGGVLFFIIPNNFMYQGWERAIKLKYSKTYFLPRYVFDYGVNKEKKRKKNELDSPDEKKSDTILTDCSVMVCPDGYDDNNFIYVPRDIHNKRLF